MTTNSTNEKLEDVVYPELSYLLMGALFQIHNELGTKYQEKHYQRAIEIKLKELKIPYQKEVMVEVLFGGEKLGKFFADFIIDGKILLETKMIWRITSSEIKQILRYLKATNLKLAIIANFKHPQLEFRRVLN